MIEQKNNDMNIVSKKDVDIKNNINDSKNEQSQDQDQNQKQEQLFKEEEKKVDDLNDLNNLKHSKESDMFKDNKVFENSKDSKDLKALKDIKKSKDVELKSIDKIKNKSKHMASLLFFIFLFLFIGLVFIDVKYQLLIHPDYQWMNYVKVFLEAGLIGALADWFAVVAIFGKPLGLNIPHTNLISNNKQKLANGIGDFVINHFLDQVKILDLLNGKKVQLQLYRFFYSQKNGLLNYLKEKDVYVFLKKNILQSSQGLNLNGETIAKKGSDYLKSFIHQGMLKTIIIQQLKKLEKEVNDDNTRTLIEQKIKDYAKDMNLDFSKNSNKNDDKKTTKVKVNFDLDNQDFKIEKIEDKNSSFVDNFLSSIKNHLKNGATDFIEPKLTQAIIDYANNYLKQNLDNVEQSVFYINVQKKLNQIIYLLENSKRIHRMIDKYLNSLLAEEGFYQFIEEKYEQQLRNKQFLIKSNHLINQGVLKIIENKTFFHQYIVNTIMQWHDKDLIENIEKNVASDLQYIRINGTLVGGLIGVLIYALNNFLHFIFQ